MINTQDPKAASIAGREKSGDVLKRIQDEYGTKVEKSRDPVKKLGKDDFFKIMVTQLKNQDPTSPYKNEEMAAQMAQFTSLEQMFNMNQNLEKLADSQKPLHHLGAAGLIGKWITADASMVEHTEGKYSKFGFELPAEASKVKIAIINEKGETIREIEKAGLKAGANTIEWDGRRSNNMMAGSGVYRIQVRAENMKGQSMPIAMSHKVQVFGVGFEGKETVLYAGDTKNPRKVLLRTVGRIEEGPESSQPSAMTAGGLIPVAGIAGGGKGNSGEQTSEQGAQSQAGEQSAVVPAQAAAPSRDIAVYETFVPGADPGQAGKYSPVNPGMMRAAAEKPVVLPQPTADDIRKALESASDLTSANPNAQVISQGGRQ